jgi:dihydroflavonol-4-reductase
MILITGATGLVGGHLAWHLLQKNEQIVAIKRGASKTEALRIIFSSYTTEPDEFLNRIEWRLADVNDKASLHKAFEGVSEVYHCAAVVSLGNADTSLMDTNLQGTRNLLDVCMETGIKKLCFVSSIAACGNSENEVVTEETPWGDEAGKSIYARSKYLSEQEVFKAIARGLNAVIVNPGVILGISGSASGSSLIFTKMRKGMPFYTPGGSAYVDVKDVVRIMIQLMESRVSGERYILLSENNTTREIITMIARGFGKPAPFIPVGKKAMLFAGMMMEITGKIFGFSPLIDRSMAKSASNRTLYSNEKIVRLLDYTFIPVAETISEVCSFMRSAKS